MSYNSGPQNEPETPIFDYSGDDVPKNYRHVEIEYSKFGVEDFDFGCETGPRFVFCFQSLNILSLQIL